MTAFIGRAAEHALTTADIADTQAKAAYLRGDDAAMRQQQAVRDAYDGTAAQLLAAVEALGVDDTRAALREIRERNAAKEN